jgi:O-antigen/teichoic acid export membrane protein
MGVRRNTAYNLLGSFVPMVVGLITVPIYLRLIGEARYGVLALVWLFLGYFGLFDPGITRAALFHLARLDRSEHERERESVFWTALAINLCFGIVGGIVLYIAGKPFFLSTFKMPASMRVEVIDSLPWLAASVPLSIVTGVLGGALQAREGFGAYNLISGFNAFATLLVPLAVAYWHGPYLEWLIVSVLIVRTVGAIPSLVVLRRLLPLGVGGRFEKKLVRTLFSYGGWVTISNLINPILTSMDRMVIGGIIGAQGVAIYTVPFNLVSRISMLPAAFATSLFPKLSRGSRDDSKRLAQDSLTALSAVMTPLIVATVAILPTFMRLWVGATFSQRAAPIGVVLLAGVWINSLAVIPFEHLQAIDRPDITAKFHAIECIPFLAVLWLGLHYFGLIGAAWAWSLRVAFDAVLLLVVAGQRPAWDKIIPGGALVLAAVLFVPANIVSAKSLIELLLLVISLIWSWNVSLLLRNSITQQARAFSRRIHVG